MCVFATGPRMIAAPEPSSIFPCSLASPPGTSVAHVTSIAIAISGSSANTAVREPGCERAPRGARAVIAGIDLFLHGGNGDDIDLRVTGLGYAARGLERDVRAEPVVHRLRGDPVVRQLERLAHPDRGVARAHELLRVFARRRADVDEEIGVAERLAIAALLARAAATADDTGDEPFTRRNNHSLRRKIFRVESAEHRERQQPVLADVGDRGADL